MFSLSLPRDNSYKVTHSASLLAVVLRVDPAVNEVDAVLGALVHQFSLSLYIYRSIDLSIYICIYMHVSSSFHLILEKFTQLGGGVVILHAPYKIQNPLRAQRAPISPSKTPNAEKYSRRCTEIGDFGIWYFPLGFAGGISGMHFGVCSGAWNLCTGRV